MTAVIAGAAMRTCFGSGDETFAALLRGECGVTPLRHGDPARLNVAAGYHVGTDDPHRPFRAGQWLSECVREALDQAGVEPGRQRVVALVGTGLRELSAVEAMALGGPAVPAYRLHFGAAVRTAAPAVGGVVTLANACSASGHALALAQDLVELGEADAVVVGGADAMTQSMLAMIGRVVDDPTDRVRPFDRDRRGVLLGEGAAAVVVVPADRPGLARLVATGLSCDAFHETAPSREGIVRAMRDAYDRAGRDPAEADLVVAHGTGTPLNDACECEALREVVLDAGGRPAVTAVKGALGHMSGTAALVNLDVAMRCLAGGDVPPVVGLREPLAEGDGLDLVRDRPVRHPARLAQVNAFGFGGVNAVTLVEPR